MARDLGLKGLGITLLGIMIIYILFGVLLFFVLMITESSPFLAILGLGFLAIFNLYVSYRAINVPCRYCTSTKDSSFRDYAGIWRDADPSTL